MKKSNLSEIHPTRISARLMLGTALVGTAALLATAAQAQNENIVVTGTSIRGVQPVGAAIINVDRQAIEDTAAVTTTELLTNIPQITGASGGFGSSGQRNEGGGGALSSPNIHSLGTQASTATLVLIDGHIIAPSGQSTNVVDPSLIPTAALQRVDVLPDGASAIYGANAVAGVINFVTRRDFSGWETRAQAGMADHYSTFAASQLFGHTWDTGSVMATYSYSSRSNLFAKWRDFMTARQDIRMGALTPEQAAQFTFSTANPPAGLPVSLVSASNAVAGSDQYRGMAIPFPSIGSNFQNFNCPVAAISTSTSGNAYLYPYTSGGINSVTVTNGSGGTTTQSGYRRSVTGGGTQGVCDQQDYSSDLISSTHNSVLVAIRQNITDNISLSIDLVRGSHMTTSRASRGNVNATVFNPAGTGGPTFGAGQTNPFYVGVPGASATANSEYITFNFEQLLGPGAYSKANNINQFAAIGVDWDLGNNWAFSLGSTLGSSESISHNYGTVAAAQAALALNGTTATSGNTSNALSDPYALGNVATVTRTLTTANALDVWMPAATNRTSASVLRSLTDNSANTTVYNNVADVTVKVDGPLPFDLLGAGPIKAAFGADYYHLTQPQYRATNNGAGPSSTSSAGTTWAFARTSYSAFAEFLIPIVNQDMGIPLVNTLTLDISGRYDSFSDFGDTKNPKVSLAWGIVDGLQARGTFSTSFVAPNVHDVGGSAGVNSQTAVSNTQITNSRIIPFLSVDPLPYSQGPFSARGVGTAGTFVENATSCLALNSVAGLSASTAKLVDIDGATPTSATLGSGPGQTYGCRLTTSSNSGFSGLQIGGANATLKPERGLTYSAGIDFDAGRLWDVLDGLSGSVTYYQTKFIDVITNQQVQANIPEATSFGPAVSASNPLGGWAITDPLIQDILGTRAVTGSLPARVYTIVDNRIQNPFIIWQGGLDFNVNYRVETEEYGTFTWSLNGNQILRFSQKPNSSTGILQNVQDCRNNARYCSSEFAGSTRIGWRMDAFSAGLTFNYMHAFNVPNNTFPYSLPGPDRVTSYQHIGSLQTYDLNLGYTLPEEWLDGTSLSLTVTNVFDTSPPFYDNANGFSVGSEIGRLISFGVVKKW